MNHELDSYNNSPHTATKIAPNKANEDNKFQVLRNKQEKKKKGEIILN